jgi:hypothetical protein
VLHPDGVSCPCSPQSVYDQLPRLSMKASTLSAWRLSPHRASTSQSERASALLAKKKPRIRFTGLQKSSSETGNAGGGDPPSQANLPRFSTSLVRSVRATRHLPRVNPKGTSQKKKPRRISAAPGLAGRTSGGRFCFEPFSIYRGQQGAPDPNAG